MAGRGFLPEAGSPDKRKKDTQVLRTPSVLGTALRMRGIRTTCTHDERCGCGLATHFLTAHGNIPDIAWGGDVCVEAGSTCGMYPVEI